MLPPTQLCGRACMQAKAALPNKGAGDLKNKIKSTPSATMGLSFELAVGLQGQDNQSENYPSPEKGYTPSKPNDNIGPIPDKVRHHPESALCLGTLCDWCRQDSADFQSSNCISCVHIDRNKIASHTIRVCVDGQCKREC